MLQKVLLERDDLEALRRGEDKLIMIGDQRILLGYHGRLNGVSHNGTGRPKGSGPTPKVFTPEFKHAAMRRMRNGASVDKLATELRVRKGLLYSWRRQDAKLNPKARRRLPKNGVRGVGSDGRLLFTPEFKAKAVARVKAGEPGPHVAKALKVRPDAIRHWVRAATRG